MVKKLFKHECLALGRVLWIIQLILPIVAVFTRVLQLFESDNVVYDIIFVFGILTFVVANLVNLAAPVIMAVVRYYKNLFTAEGYLTFALPVSPTQHLFVKLCAAVVFQLSACVISVLSVVIATAGDVLHEVLLAAQYLLNMLGTVCQGHLPLFIAEAVVLLFTVMLSEFLLYYACISIGQLFRKNRVLGAVGVYFAYYMIMQLISTVFMIVMSVAGSGELPVELTAEQIIAAVHIVLCGLIVWSLLMAALYFFISHTIMRKKLNLE